MTGNIIIDSAISAAGIAFAVLVIYFVFRVKPALLELKIAQEQLFLDEPDFDAADWLFSEDRRKAVAANSRGEFVLIARIGGDLISRRFSASEATVSSEESNLAIKLPDISTPKFQFGSVENAAEWARALRGDGDKLA